MRIIDLSHTIEPGMPLFGPAAPQPDIHAWMTHEQAAESGHYRDCSCEVSEVRFVTSIGTYLDSPFHFHPNGSTVDELKLEQLVLPGMVIDCSGIAEQEPIGPEVLNGVNVAGKAVLFRTDWSRFWGHPEYFRFPYLSGETAVALQEGGARLAGVDFLVIDDTTNPRRPVHVHLLGHNVLIVENLTNLSALPSGDFVFHAVPVKVKGVAAFPVRAYAVVD